jgi:hypothetical protein
MRTFASTFALAVFLAACGSDPSDTGTGSDTLLVDADFEASPEISNGSAAEDFTTDFRVRVRKNGADVTTGEVLVASAGGDVALVYSDQDGEWRGSQAAYLRDYELHVTSGDDYVHGVRLVGPDLHVFTSPDGSEAIDATVPLVVEWSREDEADTASIESREMDAVDIPDTGSFELPLGTLRSSPDQAEDEELRLTRSSRLVPSGAVAGSELRVRIENRVELIVAATGL